MSLEVNIFILVLIIIISMLLYWIWLDNSEKTEQRKVVVREKSTGERIEWSSDYSPKLSLFGLIMGGWIGYLFSPPIKILGTELKIPFSTIIDVMMGTYTDDGNPLSSITNKLVEYYAYTAIEYLITGAILGAVLGWVVGKQIKR